MKKRWDTGSPGSPCPRPAPTRTCHLRYFVGIYDPIASRNPWHSPVSCIRDTMGFTHGYRYSFPSGTPKHGCSAAGVSNHGGEKANLDTNGITPPSCPRARGARNNGRSPSWTAAAKLPPFTQPRQNSVSSTSHHFGKKGSWRSCEKMNNLAQRRRGAEIRKI